MSRDDFDYDDHPEYAEKIFEEESEEEFDAAEEALFGESEEGEEPDEEGFGYEGECAGCDAWARLDDQGLCDVCGEKLERDFIRLRDWNYSTTAFACPKEKLEELRKQVIKEYGAKLELIADPKTIKN